MIWSRHVDRRETFLVGNAGRSEAEIPWLGNAGYWILDVTPLFRLLQINEISTKGAGMTFQYNFTNQQRPINKRKGILHYPTSTAAPLPLYVRTIIFTYILFNLYKYLQTKHKSVNDRSHLVYYSSPVLEQQWSNSCLWPDKFLSLGKKIAILFKIIVQNHLFMKK